MAYTLKTSGLATEATSIIAVDEDGTTIKDFVSSSRTSHMTIDTGVTVGSSTWKGTSRKYFQTQSDGTYYFKGLRFASGYEIAFNNASSYPGSSVFLACAGADARGGNGSFIPGFGNISSDHFYVPGSHAGGTTAVPTDLSTKFSLGGSFIYGGTWTNFYGLESGSLAADGTGTDGGYGSNLTCATFGGLDGQGNAPGKWHILVVLPRPMTLAEEQSLHNDWFGTLFDSGGGGGGGTSLFRNSPGGALSGLGSGGPFFQNPLQ